MAELPLVPKPLLLMSGSANRPLAEEIAQQLETELCRVTLRQFADGELFVRIDENVRGRDVYIIQPTNPPGDNLLQLLLLMDAARRASAARITAVIPYFGYARQDRKYQPRVAISAKLMANMVSTAGADRVLAIDFHQHQLQGFFDLPVDHLYAAPLFVNHYRQKQLEDVVVVAPDVGSAKMARESRFQAILPIRGKILNVEKARIDRILANKEVEAIINAFGTGIQEDFDINKLRYHKIILMADADVDGAHIRTLLLTLLFRFMQPLIDHGHVYLAQPPLFRLRWSNSPHELAYNDEERDALHAYGIENGKKLPQVNPIQRYKGLGEMDADDLWDTTMDPEKRILKQVTLEDAAMTDQMFSILMGEDVVQRRSFIQHNARDVRFLDI